MREGGKGEGKEKVNECTQIHKEGTPPPPPQASQSLLYMIIPNPNPQPLPRRTIYM